MKHLQFPGPSSFYCRLAIALALGFLEQTSVLDAHNSLFARAQTPAQSSRPKTQKLSNPLNDLLDEAQRDIDANNFDAAVSPLQKFIAEKPEVAYAHFQLAYAYTALKRSDEARAEYERAMALDPKMPEAPLNLGILLLDTQHYADAIVPLRKAVDLLPAQSRPRFLLAVAEDRSGDQAAAKDSFAAVLRLEPNNFTALHYLGDMALREKHWQEAETYFRRALEVQPNAPEALQGLAKSLDAENKPEAVDAYRKYLEVEAGDVGARERLVRLLIQQQEFDGALAELDHANADKPPTADSLRMRADIQIAQKKFSEAVITLTQAIKLSPQDAQLVGGLGRVYMQKRDFPSAETQLKRALQMDGKNPTYWKDLASTYYLDGNCPAALGTLDVVAKLETPTAGTWFMRGLCYDKLRQIKPALEAYQQFLALEQGTNSDQVWQAEQRSKVLKHMLEEKR